MLTARLSIRYAGDWTAAIGRLGVRGDIYSATLHERQYMGLIRIHGESLDEPLRLIEDAPYHTSFDVVQRYAGGGHEHATILVTAKLEEETPFVVMLQNGYMPLDPTGLKNGREYFDLILRDRERLLDLMALIEPVGNVKIERVVSGAETSTQPSSAAWSAMLANLTDRQFEVLSLAVERGYFEVPRGATLADIASELDIEKSTASEHVRRGVGRIASFVVENTGLVSRRRNRN